MKRQLYIVLKAIIPRTIRRRLQRFMPRRIVMPLNEIGVEVKFIFYPHEGAEDFGLLADHEVRLRNSLPSLIAEGDVAFDVGSHYGLYTILMASIVGPQGQVHAFDPFERNIKRIKENIEVNRLNNIVLNTTAVSDHKGQTGLIGNSSKTASIKLTHEGQNRISVPTIDLDSYWQAVGQPDVRLVKIDVEGAEDLVITGMQQLIQACNPTILLEVHLFALSAGEINAILLNLIDKHSYAVQLEEVMYGNANYAHNSTDNSVNTHNFFELTKNAHTAFLRFTKRKG